MTGRTFDAWCPEVPLTMADNLKEIEVNVESARLLRCVLCPKELAVFDAESMEGFYPDHTSDNPKKV